MDGNQLLAQMKRLSEAETVKDVRPLTAAMFPGTHCPLMGAAMAVRGISDAMMLIIGTDECTYYTKHFSVHAENFGGLNGRCVSVALDALPGEMLEGTVSSVSAVGTRAAAGAQFEVRVSLPEDARLLLGLSATAYFLED